LPLSDLRGFKKMGFLRRVRVPDELPDLAIEDGSMIPVTTPSEVWQGKGSLPQTASIPSTQTTRITSHKEIQGEDFLEFQDREVQRTGDVPEALLTMAQEDKEREGYFSKVLEDINGEMGDIGNLGDWYNEKFSQQDVVSDMKSYWEENKADMIIRSFGSEYKKKISAKLERLRQLEDEWREIYFGLIKKEEEMKREEKMLKETVSEFVELCKRKKQLNEEETKEGVEA